MSDGAPSDRTPGEGPRAEQRRDLAVTGLVALAVRLVVAALAWDRFPPADDGVYYDTLARRLAHGLGYTWAWPDGAVTPVAHYPVGYPALLALAYRVLGERPGSALALHALVGAGFAVCMHVVASASGSRRAARWVGLVSALHPALLTYSPAIMTEGVFAALLALPFALAVTVRAVRTRGVVAAGLAYVAGLALGGASLVRPQGLLLIPVVAWVAASAGSWPRRATAAALVAMGALVAVAPWTVRNERVFGRFVPVSANGGWNLLIGTDSGANGGWRPVDVPPECRAVWDEAEKDACFGRAARARICGDPAAWLGLLPSKLAATLDVGGSGPSYLSRSRPDLVPRWSVLAVGGVETVFERLALLAALLQLALEAGARRRARQVIGLGSAAFLVTRHAWPAYVGLAAVLSLLGRHELEEKPLLGASWGVLVSTLVTHAVFFGAGRYALVLYPWVAAVAALAVPGVRAHRKRTMRERLVSGWQGR